MANCVVRYPLYFETLINKIKLNLYIPFSAQKSEVWSESAIYPLLYLVAPSAVQVGLRLLFSLPPAG